MYTINQYNPSVIRLEGSNDFIQLILLYHRVDIIDQHIVIFAPSYPPNLNLEFLSFLLSYRLFKGPDFLRADITWSRFSGG